MINSPKLNEKEKDFRPLKFLVLIFTDKRHVICYAYLQNVLMPIFNSFILMFFKAS